MRENGPNWQRKQSCKTQNNLGEQHENAKKHMKLRNQNVKRLMAYIIVTEIMFNERF
jgi:hypothetical protein